MQTMRSGERRAHALTHSMKASPRSGRKAREASTRLCRRFSLTMVLWGLLASLAAAWSSAHAARSQLAPPAAPELDLRIAADGWGASDVEDIRRVLTSAAQPLWQYFPGRRIAPIRVIPGNDSPLTLFEKSGDGEYIVRLTARDDRWYQFAYQFAHE